MTGHLPLFEAPPAARDTDTSRAAASAITPSAARLRMMVLGAIRAAGPAGLTADEAADRLGLSVLTVRPRVSELGKAGSIVDAGSRRANRSGRKAIVWRVRA